jgi:hypothetical protein
MRSVLGFVRVCLPLPGELKRPLKNRRRSSRFNFDRLKTKIITLTLLIDCGGVSTAASVEVLRRWHSCTLMW